MLDGLIKQTEQRDYTSFLARPPSSRLARIKVDRESFRNFLQKCGFHIKSFIGKRQKLIELNNFNWFQ